jgi:hypothetical protein
MGGSRESKAKYIVPAVLGLMGTGLGLCFNHSISQRAEREQSARLYTELLNRREEAESDLRKDMFAAILKAFLEPVAAKGDGAARRGADPLAEDLLKLELLALNFGESLNLGPLFAEMNRRIHTDAAYTRRRSKEIDKPKYMSRLERLARRVADRQLAALAPESKQSSFRISMPGSRVESGVYVWPRDEIQARYPDDGDKAKDEAALEADLVRDLSCQVLEDVARQVTVAFSNADLGLKTVDVKIDLTTTAPDPKASRACRKAISQCLVPPEGCSFTTELALPIVFTLDHFNFPMIDNAVLSYDQRLALVIHEYREGRLEVRGLLFPGRFASRRDKPSFDHALEQLQSGSRLRR